MIVGETLQNSEPNGKNSIFTVSAIGPIHSVPSAVPLSRHDGNGPTESATSQLIGVRHQTGGVVYRFDTVAPTSGHDLVVRLLTFYELEEIVGHFVLFCD